MVFGVSVRASCGCKALLAREKAFRFRATKVLAPVLLEMSRVERGVFDGNVDLRKACL